MRNHLLSLVVGAFLVTMLALMAVPLAVILLRSYWP